VPFEGETAVAIAMRHVSEPPVPPSELNPRVTPDLERVVLRALAKAPEDRYATADEMGIDLDRVRKGLPVAGVGTATAATRPLARPATETMVAPVPAAPAYAGNGPVAYSDAAGRPAKRRLWPWLLLLAIVALSAGLAYAAVNALDGGEDDAATTATTPTTAPVERVAVPALGGKSFDEASRLLAARGLRAERRNTFEERPAGTVIGQSPRARTQVERDSVVVLTVSRGPRPVAVPGVTGQSEQAATQALTQAGFKVAVRREASEEVPEGQVIRQEPAAQAQSTAGATVTLVVSSGSSRVEVPNVVNATEGEARQRLADAGLKVGRVTRQPSEGVERGRVIESRPGATERVAPGSAVELVVSGGPEEVTVPSVVGETEQAARARLRAQGFEVEVERVDTDDQTQDGVVQEQDPPAEAAATERRVTIVVGRFKQP
jgi:serine/threonine-protein kinase